MATTTNVMKMQILLRRDTAANWELHNDIIPAAGEPCFVLDKNILKIGDGIHSFGELEPINGAKIEIAADGKSIVLEDNTLKLMGFEDAPVGAQPRKNADGNIEWIVPSTETVEGLKVTVAGLQSDVANLQSDVAGLKEIVGSTEGGSGTLLSRIEGVEHAINGTGEGTIDAKINAKINEFANEINDNGTVDTLKELIDYVANHGGEVETIVNDVMTLQQLVGTESVSEQINTAISNSGHITKAEAENTFIKGVKVNGTLLDMIDGVVEMTVPEIKGSDEIDVNEDGTLSIKKISFDKIDQGDLTIVMDGGSAV